MNKTITLQQALSMAEPGDVLERQGQSGRRRFAFRLEGELWITDQGSKTDGGQFANGTWKFSTFIHSGKVYSIAAQPAATDEPQQPAPVEVEPLAVCGMCGAPVDCVAECDEWPNEDKADAQLRADHAIWDEPEPLAVYIADAVELLSAVPELLCAVKDGGATEHAGTDLLRAICVFNLQDKPGKLSAADAPAQDYFTGLMAEQQTGTLDGIEQLAHDHYADPAPSIADMLATDPIEVELAELREEMHTLAEAVRTLRGRVDDAFTCLQTDHRRWQDLDDAVRTLQAQVNGEQGQQGDTALVEAYRDGWVEGYTEGMNMTAGMIRFERTQPEFAPQGQQGELRVEPTSRGFMAGEFKDHYGAKCSIQESSVCGPAQIWLGIDSYDGSAYHNNPPAPFSRMLLTKKHVKALLPLLKHFVKYGTLPTPAPPVGVPK